MTTAVASSSAVSATCDSADASPRRRRLAGPAVALLASLLVVVAHFRPWEGGLVEEWGLVLAWRAYGFGAYTEPAYLTMTLGRPLHLLPSYLLLQVFGGSVTGMHLGAALAGLAQLGFAQRALRTLGVGTLLRWSLALAVALHPWWADGYALRFLPAQVAIALVLAWLAAVAAYCRDGRRRWLVLGAIALLTSLLTYPAPALTVFFGLAALAIAHRVDRRRLVSLAAMTTGVVGVYGLWAVVVAPRLADTYERQIMDGGSATPMMGIRVLVRTVALLTPGLLAVLAVVAVVVLTLGFTQRLDPTRAWIALLLAAGTVGAGLVYYPSLAHLGSVYHVPLTGGLAAWLLLCGLATLVDSAPRLRVLVAGVALLAVVAGSVSAHLTFRRLADGQQSMLDAAEEVRPEVREGEQLVVADASGYYGSMYLFVPPHIDLALEVETGPGLDAVLCTDTGAPRQPGTATPDCAGILDVPAARFLGSDETTYGEVEFYAVPVPSGPTG